MASRRSFSLLAMAILIFIRCGLFRISRVAAESKHMYGQFPFVANASTAPVQSEYDYIIVGGGTAGCPLGATLSQSHSVLLLERGGAPFDKPAVQNQLNYGQLLTEVDDAIVSAVQSFQSEEGVFNRRARILGGGSAVNAGFYGRAEPRWILDRGLDLARVNEAYEWVEKVVASIPSSLGPWQSAVRDALLEVGVSPYNGVTYHHMIGTKIGGTTFDSDGRRHTAADLLEYADPHNIQVLLYGTGHQITFTSDSASEISTPKTTGVIYTDELGLQHQALLSAKAGTEVILSAGALGSPQLLLLSGIGPAAHLKEFNIPVFLDQPAVGQKMADNPTLSMIIPSKNPLEDSLISAAGVLPSGFLIEGCSGTSTSFGEMRNLNTLPPEYRNQKTVDNFTSLVPLFPPESFSVLGQAGVLLGKLAEPISRGYLKLTSANVLDNPSVRFNYLAEPQDVLSCVEGVRVMQGVVRSRAMENFVFSRDELPDAALTWAGYVGPLAPESDDAALLSQWCRDTVFTISHCHGGCQEGVVVDKAYRLIGVDSLRVIDGSTFSSSPGTNPLATLMMLGRYMGLQILDEQALGSP